MTNWKDGLKKETKGEEIIAINIDGILYEKDKLSVAISRIDSIYSKREGHSFWVWTESTIYFCGTYDSKISIDKVPRNPSEEMPYSVGE